MSDRYRVSNCFGQNTISAERALQIWHSWPAELRKAKNDDPKVGFQVWAYYEATERVLMRTRIEPIDEDGDYSGYRETATRIYDEKNDRRAAIAKAFLSGGKG